MRLIATLPIAVVAGFGIGFASFRDPRPLTSTAPAALRAQELTTETAVGTNSPATTEAKTQRLIAATLRKGNSLERESEMYLAIEAFTAQDFERLLAEGEALKALPERLRGIYWRDLASALIGRWLKLNPGPLMTWAPRLLELIPAKEEARGWMLDALSEKRPGELLALVPSRKDAAEREEIISRALRELAAQDPAKARAWFDRCTDAADRRVAEKAMLLGMVKGDPLRAIELAGAIENRDEACNLLRAAASNAAQMGPGVLRQLATTPMKSWMLAPVLNEFAKRDPELAVDLALKAEADGNNRFWTLQPALYALAQRDPARATAKFAGMEASDLATAVYAIGLGWEWREPAAALTWLAERPVAERTHPLFGNDVLATAFSDWAFNAPADARAWADALPPGATRNLAQTQLARSLAERGNPGEATQVLARLGPAAESKAFVKVASAWARRDPQAAADWALAQEPGSAQNRALAGIVGAWSNDDPRGVEKWLAQFPPGESRDRSIVAFLDRRNAYILTDNEHAAEFDAWFDLIEDPWQRTLVARGGFLRRKQEDPVAARTWLLGVPNLDADLVARILRTNLD